MNKECETDINRKPYDFNNGDAGELDSFGADWLCSAGTSGSEGRPGDWRIDCFIFAPCVISPPGRYDSEYDDVLVCRGLTAKCMVVD